MQMRDFKMITKNAYSKPRCLDYTITILLINSNFRHAPKVAPPGI